MPYQPVAMIECSEQIPCNPCETACSQGAIFVGEPITNRPVIDTRRCVGCGLCVVACPGLAIYMVRQINDNMAEMTFPYEFLPRPKVGQSVTAVNNAGEDIGIAKVEACWQPKGADGTYLVTISLLSRYLPFARGIRRLDYNR